MKIGLNSNRKLRSKESIPLQVRIGSIGSPNETTNQVSRFVEDYGAMIQGIPHTRDWILKIAQRKALNSLDLGN